MSLSGRIITRVFQLKFRNNVLNFRQKSCSYLIRQPEYLHNRLYKPAPFIVKRLVSTKPARSQARAMGALSPLDPSSYSRPELAVIKHIKLALNVDFEKQVLNGEATISFEILADVDDLILDTSNLKIESIETEGGSQLQYKLGENVPNYGSKLTILLPKQAATGEKNFQSTTHVIEVKSRAKAEAIRPCKNTTQLCTSLMFNGQMYQPEDNHVLSSSTEEITCESTCKCLSKTEANLENSANCQVLHLCELSPPIYSAVGSSDSLPTKAVEDPSVIRKEWLNVKIKYSTDPSASALQWLDAAQTSGKKHPYLFSQCQPIHARSILPCQDTPAVKFTYDAEVTAPEEFTVLMSALRGEVKNNITKFNQPVPIPSNLFAIAVAVLEYRSVGPRSKVWSEKQDIDRNAREFELTESYLQAAEKLCGPYDWTVYDLLVLPPSFPHGAMENPCITFVSPTIVVGDRSLANVIIHEIMHSWTGNSLTIKNFEHFWLKEGFTVFLERKVTASLINDTAEAKRKRDFQSLLGLQQLREGVSTLGHSNPLTKLVLNLKGVHPDEAFSIVPYEKGSLFLRYLEDYFGGPEVFDGFIRAYVKKFSMQSFDTDQFKDFFCEYFKGNDKLDKVDWDTWLHGCGMPPIIPNYDKSMTEAVTALVKKIEDLNSELSYGDVEQFDVHQMIHLLQRLIENCPLPIHRLRTLGEVYKIVGNKNNEILYRWLRLNVRSRHVNIIDEVFDFLNSLGRLKYVRPLYRELYDWKEVRGQAIENFLANEKFMSHLTAYNLRKDLHLDYFDIETPLVK